MTSAGGLTVEGHEEAHGAVVDPFADAIASALLDAGEEGRVIDDAVEHLASGRIGFVQAALLERTLGLRAERGAGAHDWRCGCRARGAEGLRSGRRAGGLRRRTGLGDLKWLLGT